MEEIRKLIEDEQVRQRGRLIENGTVEGYFEKITGRAEFLVHYIGGQCAGFIAFYCNDPDRVESYVTMLITNPDFRGQRVASSLLDSVLAIAHQRGFEFCALEVNKDNEAAISLYEKKGFVIYKDLLTSCFMKKKLKD